MPITITIPDKVIKKCKQVVQKEQNIEDFVIEAVSNYVDEINDRKKDPFLDFITSEKSLKNKDNLTDISVNHDKHIY